jgi:hypothetical protein
LGNETFRSWTRQSSETLRFDAGLKFIRKSGDIRYGKG